MTAITARVRTEALRLYLRTRSAPERGASLVEYALLVALIAIVCIAAVSLLAGETSESFSRSGRSVAQS